MQIHAVKQKDNLGEGFRYHTPKSAYHLFVLFQSDAMVLAGDALLPVSKGTFMFFDKDKPQHYFGTRGDFIHDFVRFSLEDEEDAFLFRRLPKNTPLAAPAYMGLSAILDMMEGEFYGGALENGETLARLGQLLLTKAFVLTKGEQAENMQDANYVRLLVIRKYIMQAVAEPLSIDMLAKKASFSRSYFQFLYKKFFGVSCMQDIINARLGRAKFLLKSTDKPVYDIAKLCGYENVEHFSRHFKAELGLSPRAWRQKNKY